MNIINEALNQLVKEGIFGNLANRAKEKYHSSRTNAHLDKVAAIQKKIDAGKISKEEGERQLAAVHNAARSHADKSMAARYKRTGSTLGKHTNASIDDDASNIARLKRDRKLGINEEVDKSKIPAAQRKAKGGDWKVTKDDLEKEASKSPTGKAGLDAKKKALGVGTTNTSINNTKQKNVRILQNESP